MMHDEELEVMMIISIIYEIKIVDPVPIDIALKLNL